MTAAERPTTLDILGQAFTIDWVGWDGRLYSDPRHISLDDRDIVGTTEVSYRRIGIRSTGVIGLEREVVIHEIVHVLMLLQGHDGEEIKQETIAQALGVGLLQVLRQNPHLVAFLTGDA